MNADPISILEYYREKELRAQGIVLTREPYAIFTPPKTRTIKKKIKCYTCQLEYSTREEYADHCKRQH